MNTPAVVTAESVRADLTEFLGRRIGTPVAPDADLFAAAVVSSLSALQLVVHVEQAFGVTVHGPDLVLANFRTVDAIAALVLRLCGQRADGTGGDG